MATVAKKGLQDLANMIDETPADKVRKPNKKDQKIARKMAQAEQAEELKAKFAEPVKAKAKKVAAPKPAPVKMEVTTLEDLAKVVKPHKVVLPAGLKAIGTDPVHAALIEAAKFHQSAIMAGEEREGKVEILRQLLKDREPFNTAYLSTFSEHMTAYQDQPGYEWAKALLESKEKHAQKFRAAVAEIINKALATKHEASASYLEIDAEIKDLKSWLAYHENDSAALVDKAKSALGAVGVRYDELFATR
jgi:hypothetical protein